MSISPSRRCAVLGAAGLLAAALGAAAPTPAAQAATPIGVTPARVINAGSNLPLVALADDGRIYASDYTSIDVWAPDSDGTPTVEKTFTGINVNGVPALHPTAGLAFADGPDILVLDPDQADGPAVAVRTISGATTGLDSPSFVAWTPNGSLWVIDTNPSGANELLRFAPGADGDVAPVQVISGPRTHLDADSSLGVSAITGLPGNGVAVAPAGVEVTVSVFSASQSGNVAPTRRFAVPAPGPHWLSEGIAADSAGRIYIGYGDLNGSDFGRLDVFGPTADGNATPVLTLGGSAQRFQLPLVPSVASDGSLALTDATILDLGGSTTQSARVKVFDPLFTKPGKVTGLKVAASAKEATVTWKAGANPSGTPVTFQVTVTKGTTKVLSSKTGSPQVILRRTQLPKGKLRVSVRALNVGGASPTAARTFKN